MKLLLDMNLSPTWVGFLEENGFEAVHWSRIGAFTATDAVIMTWARGHGFIVEFRIADTFTDSLTRLTGDEQKAVKTTAFDLQINPVSPPGMSFHKLAKSRDKGFCSVRVSQDVRLIVHRTAQSLLLCYVDHHDRAYAWAECRKIETHPTTGAAQLVEIRERVQEIAVPSYVPEAAASARKRSLFAHVPESDLLGCGVPPEWIGDVRQATEDTVLSLADHLPAEALLELATGGTPQKTGAVAPATSHTW